MDTASLGGGVALETADDARSELAALAVLLLERRLDEARACLTDHLEPWIGAVRRPVRRRGAPARAPARGERAAGALRARRRRGGDERVSDARVIQDLLREAPMTRRGFVAGSLGTMAAALLAGKFGALEAFGEDAAVANSAVDPLVRDREIYTMCEMCVWRCGVRAKVGTARSSSWTATRSIRTRAACSARAARPAS